MAGFRISVRAPLEQWQKDLRDMRDIGRRAATETAAAIQTELRSELQRRQGALREFSAAGIINKDEFRRLSQDAVKEFNAGVLTALRELRKRGQEATPEFEKLQRSLRQVGTAGRQGAQEAQKGVGNLLTSFTAVRSVVAGLVTLLGIRRGIAFVREAISDAEELAKSFLQLQSAAKLFNVSQKDMADLAARARSEFALSTRDANELAIGVTKFAARAGDATRAQDLLTRALDLGAAQGLTAAQVTLALDQALRGVDEGTDRLLQKNPSTIYAEFAASIGKAAGRLTEVEQKQAIVNAIIAAGQRVQGAYGDVLETNVGRLTRWRQRLQEASEEIGSHAVPVITRLTTALAGPLASAVETVSGLFDAFADPLDRILLRMEKLGQASELALPLILEKRIEGSRKAIERLEQQFQQVGAAGRSGVTGGSALEAEGASPRALAALSGTDRGARDLLQLQRDVTDAQKQLNAAVATGAKDQIESAQTVLGIALDRLSIAQQIAAEERRQREAQAGLGVAEQRAALRGQLAAVESEIRELIVRAATEGESQALIATQRVLEQRRDDLVKQLEGVRTETPRPTLDPVDADAAKRAEAALERLNAATRALNAEREAAAQLGLKVYEIPDSVVKRLEELKRLETEIAALRKLQTESGRPGAGEDVIQARIAEQARLRASLDDTIRRIVDVTARARAGTSDALVQVGRLGDSIARGIIRTITPIARSIPDLVKDVQNADAQLSAAILAGDRERERSARQSLEERRAALREASDTLLRAFEDTGPSADQLRTFITQIVDALHEAGIEVEGLGAKTDETARGFEDVARSIEVVVRGLISALDAMDALDDGTRRVLTGITDIAAGAGRIAAGDVVGGAIGVIGGALNVGRGLFGGDDARDAAERESEREEFRQNTQAIADLTDQLRSLESTIGPLQGAMERAIDAAFKAAEAVTGFPTLRSATTPRAALEGALELAEQRVREAEQDASKSLADAVSQRNEIRNALDEFIAFVERLRERTLASLQQREARATGGAIDFDLTELGQRFREELDDAIAAFGVDSDVVARIREVQQAEIRAREEQAKQDAEIRKLEAEGKTQLARVTRLIADQEKRLAQLRIEGASAAELEAEAEAQRAERRQFATDLRTSLLDRAAERSGDPERIRARQELRLAVEFADTSEALQKLRDNGDITADEFAELADLLRDDFAAAMEEAAEAAREAAEAMQQAKDDFELDLAGDIAGLTPDAEDDKAVARDRVEAEAKERRKRAREFFGDDPQKLQQVLQSIDDWLRLALQNIEGTEALALPTGGRGAEATIRSLSGFSETTALGIQDYTRQTAQGVREIPPILRDIRDAVRGGDGANKPRPDETTTQSADLGITFSDLALAELRATTLNTAHLPVLDDILDALRKGPLGSQFNAADFLPSSPGNFGARGVSLNVDQLLVQVTAGGSPQQTEQHARAAARGVLTQFGSDLESVDKGLQRLTEESKAASGVAALPSFPSGRPV